MTGFGYEQSARMNGFKSLKAMDLAHAPIVRLCSTVVQSGRRMVLDLGCGDGTLLKKLCTINSEIVPFGIDLDHHKILHAKAMHSGSNGDFVQGDMFSTESIWPPRRRYDLVILMPGRFLECKKENTAWLRERLSRHVDSIVLYTYNDWLRQYKGLRKLAAAAGFSIVTSIGNAVALGIAEQSV